MLHEETLESLLLPVGLTIANHKVHRTFKGVAFEATVVPQNPNEKVIALLGKSVVFDPIRASGKSPRSVQETLSLILKTNWIEVMSEEGNYGIIWNADLKKFEKNNWKKSAHYLKGRIFTSRH